MRRPLTNVVLFILAVFAVMALRGSCTRRPGPRPAVQRAFRRVPGAPAPRPAPLVIEPPPLPPPNFEPRDSDSNSEPSGVVEFEETGPARGPVEPRPYASPEERIVINEIHYHPESDDPRDEWIELFNRGTEPVDLAGWKLSEGIAFTFPEKTVLEPGAFLLVCRDLQKIRSGLRIEKAVGNWTGSLSDGGERIRLASAEDREVEVVAYDDGPPFPVLPDGLGRSLERRNPHLPAGSPANWASASARSAWVHYRATGLATTSRLYFYLLGAGNAFIDGVSFLPLDGESGGQGSNLLPDGDFEEGRGGWQLSGNHAGSRITAETSHTGKGCLKLVASGPGQTRTSAAVCDLRGAFQGRRYALDFWARLPVGSPGLVARLSGSREGGGIFLEARGGGAGMSPGKTNLSYAPDLPPFVYPVAHSPGRPKPGDLVTVTARVAASARLKEVILHVEEGASTTSVPLEDDGDPSRGDASSGDGVYSARLGPLREGALVIYRVTALDEKGLAGGFPLAESPTRRLGLFVESASREEGDDELPTYGLFLSDEALGDLQGNPFSDAYRPAVFVHEGRVHADVGVRYRGQTSRGVGKPSWKVKFNKDDPFVPEPGHAEVRSVNLNGCYADKVFLRELLSFRLWRDLGEAFCESWHARLRLNGAYHGLYLYVEAPNADFLDRNGLQKGWLWKSYTAAYNPYGFELEAGEPATAPATLEGFLRNVNSLSGRSLENYLREHLNFDSFVNFLAACQLVHSADHVAKNYLVYADPAGKFTFYPWDMDLTHGRNYECDGGGVWNDRIRHDLWDRENGDEELLFGTRFNPKCDQGPNAVIDAFLGKTRAFRPEYHRRLARHLTHCYHPEVLIPKIERCSHRIRAEVAKDRRIWSSYGGDDDFDRQEEILTYWVRQRFEYLREKLQALGCPPGEPLNAEFEPSPRSGAAPLKVSFENLSVGEITGCEWSFGDGTTSSSTSPVHVYEKPGRYDVTLGVKSPRDGHSTTRRGLVFVRDASP